MTESDAEVMLEDVRHVEVGRKRGWMMKLVLEFDFPPLLVGDTR
jgi:hypothetical protein